MERKIGERIDFKGEILEVVEAEGCVGCYFNHQACEMFWNTRGPCGPRRTDKASIIFKRVDKSLELLTKANAELVRCGIESETVAEIEEYLKTNYETSRI